MTFAVGDIVTWDGENQYWQGGKAKIVNLHSDFSLDSRPWMDVEVLESVHGNELNSPVGKVFPELPKNLKLWEAPAVKDEGVGVARYTAGMPEGIEPRHIMSEQKWYEDFCKGSILKYICRLDHKGQYLSDLKKIRTYADELIKLEEAK